MKKFLLFAAAVLAIGTMTSCSDEDFFSSGNNEGDGYLHVEVEENFPENENDKNAITSKTTYGISSGILKTYFSEGDAIGVYGMNGTTLIASNVRFTLHDGVWQPDRAIPYSPNYRYYAYFPYKDTPGTFDSSSAPTSADDSNTKFASIISSWDIKKDQSTLENFKSSDLMVSRGANQSIPVVKFTMAHKMGLAEILPSYNTYVMKNISATKHMAPPYGENVPFDVNGTKFYIMKPNTETVIGTKTMSAAAGKMAIDRSSTISGGYTISYSTDGGSSFSSTCPSWLTIEDTGDSNVKFNVTLNPDNVSHIITSEGIGNATPVVDYDLSTKGGTVARETANCYIVSAPGTYKIPLVYGNAIKNGVTNTDAFAPEGFNIDTYLTPFLNHAGNGITDPWLKNNGVTVTSAALTWQDNKNLVSAVSVNGDYLEVTVPASATIGNALISAKDSEGTIVWSWHLWMMPEVYKTQSLTEVNTGSHIYNVTPLYLGWKGNVRVAHYSEGSCIVKITPDDEGEEQRFVVSIPETEEYSPLSDGVSPYYQFGRVTPEASANTLYDINNSNITAITHQTFTDGSITIGTAIQNPTKHYYNNTSGYASANGPFNTGQYNLWDAYNTKADNIATATKKTIYDPCPPGYCVPTSNLWYYMTKGNTYTGGKWVSDYDIGRMWTEHFPNMFFPATGYRQSTSGTTISNVGQYLDVWSASPTSNGNARSLIAGSGYWYWNYYNRSGGFPVRPVLEE